MADDFQILEWLVRPDQNTLSQPDKNVRIEPKIMSLLTYLAEHAGEAVSKEQILQAVWDEKFISDEVLTVSIHELRKALGDDAKSPRFIKTLPRTGYRFVAPVSHIATVPFEKIADEAQPQRLAAKLNWRVISAAVALTALVLVLGFALFSLPRTPRSHIRSVAVLPLDNLSDDAEQGYFADGMTDALITDLARMGALKVISRTSVMGYKGTRKPLREIASELNVDAVVEGTVTRSGDQIRITVQLIDGATDQHIWAEKYERHLSDVISMQSEVARAIAHRVGERLDYQWKHVAAKVSPEAYESYLRGRFFLNQRTREGVQKALSYFQKTIAEAPEYAPAYAGIASCYTDGDGMPLGLERQEAYSRATSAVRRALDLDEGLAEAHAALGGIRFQYDWNWQGAEQEFKRALDLDPNSAIAHQWYAELLSALGRHQEATAAMERAQKLNPIDVMTNGDLAWVYYMARQYDQAMDQAQKTLEMDPKLAWMHNLVGGVYRIKGMDREAVGSYKIALTLSGTSVDQLKGVSDTLSLFRWRLRDAERSGADSLPLVGAYAVLGENDKALAVLERAYRDHRLMLWLKVAPALDGLRSDARFADLLRRVGLET